MLLINILWAHIKNLKGEINMAGMKAQVKHQLRSKGIRTITTDTGKVLKLQQAKTSELIKVASKLA